MVKVMAFGTFDVLHPGHSYFLREAKKLGDMLIVVIALDETVLKVKGQLPRDNQEQRRKNVQHNRAVDKSILGNAGDKYAIIEQEKPDIIALGYDQRAFVDRLEQELTKRNLHPKIIRLKPFQEHIYKSSILKQQLLHKN
ncbi:FAD synthase [Candidatus Woesearchaeota archaeon]|nr:MAG: FAD synthase [Candidatus Woesearchaeota archaeon]